MQRKCVVLTGATRGLGLAISQELVKSGYDVVGIARNMTPEFSELKQSANTSVSFMDCDLSQIEDIYSCSSLIQQNHGRVYALINNAAIGLDGILTTMHEQNIAGMLNLNLHAPILLSKYLARGMLLNRLGRIVNISSIAARTGFNGLSVYGSTKAGLIGLTKSLARELGPSRITVNCVAPGFLETDMSKSLEPSSVSSILRRSPLSRFATVQEVAGAVMYLISENASGITGTVLTVDAGSTA